MFIAESATLAHVARPLVLSRALSPATYDIAFACDPRSKWLLGDFAGCYLPLGSISSDRFLDALARGKPLYDEATLDEYVRNDLEVLDQFRPDAVVGDFRLSLSISARLRRVPYIAISNCYWSPYWRPPRYVVPNIRTLTSILPIPLADLLFRLGRPLGFALHCVPLNRIRRRYGLPSLGSDLRRVYTDADYVLYADVPDLFPRVALPSHHKFIGPLIWSPPVPPPEWWTRVPQGRPKIYVTLGSSGQSALLPAILSSLAALDVTLVVATAGSKVPDVVPPNAFIAQYLSGEEACQQASLVVCNGGSPTSHQALAAGVPVIGIASNLDQFLNMGTLVQAGAGVLLRADRFNGRALAKVVNAMLESDTYTTAAKKLSGIMADHHASARFSTIINTAIAC